MGSRGTVHRFEVEGATLVVARHPSESAERVVLRVLAKVLAPEPELELSSPGLCRGDEPALAARRDDGSLACWVEVGRPSVARIERAARRAETVRVVATDRDPGPRRVTLPRGRRLEQWRVSAELVAALAAGLARRERWSVRLEGERLVVERGGERLEGTLARSVAPAEDR